MITDLLIHTCSILHTVPVSQNKYGEEVRGGLPISSACRFYTSSRIPGRTSSPDNGEFHIDTPKLALPPTVTITEGDTITSSVTSFMGPYRVTHVNPLADLYSSDLDHIECELEAIE